VRFAGRNAFKNGATDEQMPVRSDASGAAEEACERLPCAYAVNLRARMPLGAAGVHDSTAARVANLPGSDASNPDLSAISTRKGVTIPHLRRLAGEGTRAAGSAEGQP
jgi:hypothetical protein